MPWLITYADDCGNPSRPVCIVRDGARAAALVEAGNAVGLRNGAESERRRREYCAAKETLRARHFGPPPRWVYGPAPEEERGLTLAETVDIYKDRRPDIEPYPPVPPAEIVFVEWDEFAPYGDGYEAEEVRELP